MRTPSVDDALAFVPKGRPISVKEYLASMEAAGFHRRPAQMLLQRLLDPDDLGTVDLDAGMRLVLRTKRNGTG